jgi:hypothetical protein
VGGDGESEADAHAAGVALDRGVHEIGDLRKLDNAVVAGTDFAVLEAEDTAI